MFTQSELAQMAQTAIAKKNPIETGLLTIWSITRIGEQRFVAVYSFRPRECRGPVAELFGEMTNTRKRRVTFTAGA